MTMTTAITVGAIIAPRRSAERDWRISIKFLTSAGAFKAKRFLCGGVLNTLISYFAYALLCLFLNYQMAYLLAYVLGIAWSYGFNATHVFRVEKTIRSFCIYPSVYIVQYALSTIILWYWVETLGLPSLGGPIVAIAVTLPSIYAFSRTVLEHPRF